MTPIFEGDLASAKAHTPPLDTGTYVFEVGDPQVFARLNKQNKESFGIKFPLRVVEGEQTDRLIFFDTYFHSQGGIDAAKRFAMAVMGFKVDELNEKSFNEKYGNSKDATIDFDDKELGPFWQGLRGKNVVGVVSVSINNYEGNETLQQKFNRWMPYGG
jgi:phosphomannomutase